LQIGKSRAEAGKIEVSIKGILKSTRRTIWFFPINNALRGGLKGGCRMEKIMSGKTLRVLDIVSVYYIHDKRLIC